MMTEGSDTDDMSAFETIISSEPSNADTHPQNEAPTEQPSVPNGQKRDVQGKFAPKSGEAEPVGEVVSASEHEPETGQVPLQALHAERQKSKTERERGDRLERDLAEMRGQLSVLTQQRQPSPTAPAEPAKAPDFWEDPNKFVESSLTPVQQAIAELRYENSQMRAVAQHTEAGVNAAEEALKAAITSGQLDGKAVRESLSKSKDPVGDVVRWHLNSPEKQRDTMREQLKAELLAEMNPAPANPNSAPGHQVPLTKLPPSLTRLPAGGNAAPANDASDEGMFTSITSGRR